MVLCKCGCGGEIKKGNDYIFNHHRRGEGYWDKQREPQLCKCGCGEYANPGNRFINGHNGHNNRGERYWKSQQEPQLCECGCGKYAKPGNRFIHGHQNRNQTISTEQCKKLREAQIKRWEDPIKREKLIEDQLKGWKNPIAHENASNGQQKRFEDPIEHEKLSAGIQGIPYDEWEDFAKNQLYCPDFNDECKESNREKYNRLCFLTGLPEEKNITSTGKQQKLSVHHVDMDKGQGCNGIKWKLVPLCMSWHHKVHNELWESRIIWLLDNVWR